MKTMKLLFAVAVVLAVLVVNAAAERPVVKLLRTSSNAEDGYWIEYSINGRTFRSDWAGEQINTMAWNGMKDADREKTVNAVYGVLNARKLQFGDTTSQKMGEWYDTKKGWKNGKRIISENLIEKDYPGLVARFSDPTTYYYNNFLPKSRANKEMYDCPDWPELDSREKLGRYYFDLATSAYTALGNAEYLRTAAAVKSTAGDLIQLICEKCLVPSVTPGLGGGIGILSAPDAVGTAIDYFNSLTGWQGELEKAVVGKRANAEDALTVISQTDPAVARSYNLIMDCTAKAHEMQREVDARVNEWIASTNAHAAKAESDARVVAYRKYYDGERGKAVIADAGMATASITAQIRQLTSASALSAYLAERQNDINSRAKAWVSGFGLRILALRTVAAAIVKPVYPGSGTYWNNGKLYTAIGSFSASGADVYQATKELADYADKAEAYHYQRRDVAEQMLVLADEMVSAGQPIYNDYLAVYAEKTGGWAAEILTLEAFSLDSVSSDNGASWGGYTGFALDEKDLYWYADTDFMDEVRRARCYIRLCKNYSGALAKRQQLEGLQNGFRNKVNGSLNAARTAYNTAKDVYCATATNVPKYVSQQLFYTDSSYAGLSTAGRLLNTTGASTELSGKFLDSAGSAALATSYRNDLNQHVADYTASLLAYEDANRENYYYQNIANKLAGNATSGYGTGVSVNRSEEYQKMKYLQEDFSGLPYSHRSAIVAFGDLAKDQETFVQNYAASTGTGSDYVLNRLWNDSNFYSGTSKTQAKAAVRRAAAQSAPVLTLAAPSTIKDTMGKGSYAYHVSNYYEQMNLPTMTPHDTYMAPLYTEIRTIRAAARDGDIDPTWQLKLVKNDGTGVSTNITCAYGIPHRMPTADDLEWANPGYRLKGWGSASNSTAVAFAPESDITNATARTCTRTYYAMWTLANEQYDLYCEPNGGTLNGTNFGSQNGSSGTAQLKVTAGKTTYSTLGTATRTGYKFLGWYNREEGGEQVFDASGKAVKGGTYWNSRGCWQFEGRVRIYAHWAIAGNAYVIRFNRCNGTGETSDVGFIYGTAKALPTCSGGLKWTDERIFKGWAKSAADASKGIAWLKDAASVSSAAVKGATLNVYAVWEKSMIRFLAGGGTGSMASFGMDAKKVYLLPKCTFTAPVGKKFAGWKCSNGRRYDNCVLVFGLGNVTMTAVWE